MFMFLFLFGLWLLFNGRVTVEVCLIGLVVAGLVYAICVFALGYKPSHEKKILKRIAGYLVYVICLIWEVIKANIDVIKIILSPKAEYKPAIRHVQVHFEKNVSKVLLSNSITLTPGTVTIDQKGDEYTVLCLDEASADSIADWSLVKKLKKMEGPEWN